MQVCGLGVMWLLSIRFLHKHNGNKMLLSCYDQMCEINITETIQTLCFKHYQVSVLCGCIRQTIGGFDRVYTTICIAIKTQPPQPLNKNSVWA